MPSWNYDNFRRGPTLALAPVPYPYASVTMSVLDNFERCNQDAANFATVSGVNGLGVVGYLANQLPAPKIHRGYHNLWHVSEQLQREVLPEDNKEHFVGRYLEYAPMPAIVLEPPLTSHFL